MTKKAAQRRRASPRTRRGLKRSRTRCAGPILPHIACPEDLKSLSLSDLEQLSTEARERIIEVMSVSGGHLASNLGSVELTVALHRVFSCPTDKIIWDTSHQTYTHKLLTGRGDRFHTIRQYKGLAGFSNPQESVYDHFFAGHGGTALSLALGMAKNRDLAGRCETVVSVIGDAVLTCGLTLEALNNVPPNLQRFIVVLNDNGMSISRNVGRVTHILSRLLNNPKSTRLCQELKRFISKVPTCGHGLARGGKRLAESVKNLVSPAVFFEQFGLHYIGPVDGHDVRKMVLLFSELQRRRIGPVLVHVRTNKGEGMPQALQNPTSYHGCSPFDPGTGQFLPKPPTKPTFPKIFGKHLLKMAQNDPSLVCVTPAMSAGSCLDAFMQQFPERCIDVGIAEGHAVTFCGGMAFGKKMKVVACIYSTFLQRAFDNVFHDVCLQELPVVFAIDRGGIAGGDGHTHNGIYDIAFLSSMPNMVICQPRNGQLLRELLESAFTYGRPVAIRYPKLPTDEPNTETLEPRPLGQGEVLAEGSEVLILGLGHMCQVALELRELLNDGYGIEASVVDPIFVQPLDTELLCRLLITHDKLITIEEHGKGGLGTLVNDFLLRHGYQNVSVMNAGVPPAFIAQGKHSDIMKEIGLTPDQILRRAVQCFGLKAQAALK